MKCTQCGTRIEWQPAFGQHSGAIWYHTDPPLPMWESTARPGYWNHPALPVEEVAL